MKKALLIVLLLAITLIGAERKVMGELFTNTGCGPCVSANDHFDDIFADVEDDFVLIRYHVSWPSSADPFYLYNPSEPTTRKDFYSVSGVPFLAYNGVERSWSGASEAAILTTASTPADYAIDVIPLGMDSIRVVITPDPGVEPLQVKLFIVTTEDSIYWSAPNGQTFFMQVVRDMVNGGSGSTISIGTEPYVFTYPITLDDELVLEHMNVVAFIQDTDTDIIYNCNTSPLFAREAYAYSVSTSGPLMHIISEESDADFSFLLRNDGSSEDRYHVWVEGSDVPAGWNAECIMEGMGFDSLAFDLPGVWNQAFTVNVSPEGNSGSAEIRVNIYSENLGTTEVLTFSVSTPQGVLLVNSSYDTEADNFYRTALDDMGIGYSFWDQEQFGPIGDIAGVGYETVIWFTGDNLSNDPVGVSPRAQLRTFLADGGNLLITGNTIGRYCSTDFSFYFQNLGAMYVTTKENPSYARILPGFTVASPRYMHLQDGVREAIGPYSSGQLIMTYPDMTGAAVLNESHGGKSIYLGFALEQLEYETASDRLLQNIMDYFETGNFVTEKSITPEVLALSASHPNPFNGACKFSVNVPTDGDFLLTISDVSGREIQTMNDGELTQGTHKFTWTPDNDIPTGVYFLRLTSDNGDDLSTKTIYLK